MLNARSVTPGKKKTHQGTKSQGDNWSLRRAETASVHRAEH